LAHVGRWLGFCLGYANQLPRTKSSRRLPYCKCSTLMTCRPQTACFYRRLSSRSNCFEPLRRAYSTFLPSINPYSPRSLRIRFFPSLPKAIIPLPFLDHPLRDRSESRYLCDAKSSVMIVSLSIRSRPYDQSGLFPVPIRSGTVLARQQREFSTGSFGHCGCKEQ